MSSIERLPEMRRGVTNFLRRTDNGGSGLSRRQVEESLQIPTLRSLHKSNKENPLDPMPTELSGLPKGWVGDIGPQIARRSASESEAIELGLLRRDIGAQIAITAVFSEKNGTEEVQIEVVDTTLPQESGRAKQLAETLKLTFHPQDPEGYEFSGDHSYPDTLRPTDYKRVKGSYTIAPNGEPMTQIDRS
jgi:hypothetical protein